MPNNNRSKKPVRMVCRVIRLLSGQRSSVASAVTQSYDRISGGYNAAWTNHMRHLTDELIDRLDVCAGHRALDLTCGTGYAAGQIAHRTGQSVIGVDASEGMLAQARLNAAPRCTFVKADILEYLKTLPNDRFDRIACCWGLGYSHPLAVLRQIRRVLKPGGAVGIIDHTVFSLREVLWASMLTFAEQPDKLQRVMMFHFLTGRRQLALWYRLAGLRPQCGWGGRKSYLVGSGAEAIERLRATGAAAGFEYAADDRDAAAIFARFAEIIEERYRRDGQIPIVHRYLAGVAVK